MAARTDPLSRVRHLRLEIDGIDEEVVRLLNERTEAAIALGALRHTLGMELDELFRERLVLAHVAEANDGPLSDDGMRAIYGAVIAATREAEARASAPDANTAPAL